MSKLIDVPVRMPLPVIARINEIAKLAEVHPNTVVRVFLAMYMAKEPQK